MAPGIRTHIHGDDYVSTGKPEQLKWTGAQPENKCTVNRQLLGPGEDNAKQVNILNRIAMWDNTRGITYEADPWHVEIIIKQLQLNGAKPVSRPGTRDEGRTREGNKMLPADKETTNYLATVARCNYLPGRPDIAVAAEELARAMSKPARGDLQRLKRLARYLKGRPRLEKSKWSPV